MTRFKKGTKVICTENATNQYTKGKIYEVKEYPGRHLFLDTTYDDKGSTTNGWNPEFFIPVSEIEPFAVIAENWDQCIELINYQRNIWSDCPTVKSYSTSSIREVVLRGPVKLYFRTNQKDGYGWDHKSAEIFPDLKTLTFEQFKNNKHIMKNSGTISASDCCGVSNRLEVSPEFVKEAHKAACADLKKKIEEQFPALFPKMTFKIGDKLKLSGFSNLTFLLAAISGSECVVVCIEDGTHLNGIFSVNNAHKISEEEIRKSIRTREITKI